MRFEREQIWIGSACLSAGGVLLANRPEVLLAYTAIFLGLILLKRYWWPVPKKTLRSVIILISLIVVSYGWSGHPIGAIVAGLKVSGLFLLSLSVIRGIGPAGIHRAIRGVGRYVPGPWAQTSALILTPFLLSRLHGEWKSLDPPTRQKAIGLGAIRRQVYKLRALFQKSLAWPDRIFLAYTLRSGSAEKELKLPVGDCVRILDMVAFILAMGALVLTIVIRRI